MKALTIVWLRLALANAVVWGIVDATVGPVHPWSLCVALLPGAVLGLLHAVSIGRPRR